MFADRKDAAIKLATALEAYRGKNAVVLGIPRGGAETGYYVANSLNAEFSLLVSRKLGHPANPEYAFGAIAEDGSTYLSPHASQLSDEDIHEVVEQQKKEIERRIQVLRKGKPLPDLKGRTVVLVDDGIATGATIFAAIEMCRKKQAGRIVVAAPVSGHDMEEKLAPMVDEVVILEKPNVYFAVSQAYQSFYNLTDEDAVGFMDRWEMTRKSLSEREN